MALYLTEQDVGRLLTMEACVEAVEQAFRQWADGRADNRPRARATVRGAVLHALAAGSDVWGRLAAKVYATTRQGARFVVRSEEHTSELQSQSNLVCRLLLEKKKKGTRNDIESALMT